MISARAVALAGGAGVVAAGGVTSARIRRGGRARPLVPADAILVFGASVWPTGPSLSLQVRVERAFQAYAEGLAPTILCSGGWSGGASEATVMRHMLLERGVPADAVIPDDGGVTTRAAIRSARRFGAGRWRRVIAVSSPYHLHRIRSEAARQGLEVALCPAPRHGPRTRKLLVFDVRQHLRELIAVPSYALGWHLRGAFDRGWGRIVWAGAVEVRGRIRSLAGEADAVALASGAVAERIKERVAGFSDTATVLTPAAKLDWPLDGVIGDTFGLRYRRLHAGLDIRAGYGTPVMAAAEGRVVFAGDEGPYGNLLTIDHGGGLATVYAHLASHLVAEGDAPDRGQQIGFVGSTGKSYGAHLHFEVRIHGTPVDPMVYLADTSPGSASHPSAQKSTP